MFFCSTSDITASIRLSFINADATFSGPFVRFMSIMYQSMSNKNYHISAKSLCAIFPVFEFLIHTNVVVEGCDNAFAVLNTLWDQGSKKGILLNTLPVYSSYIELCLKVLFRHYFHIFVMFYSMCL